MGSGSYDESDQGQLPDEEEGKDEDYGEEINTERYQGRVELEVGDVDIAQMLENADTGS